MAPYQPIEDQKPKRRLGRDLLIAGCIVLAVVIFGRAIDKPKDTQAFGPPTIASAPPATILPTTVGGVAKSLAGGDANKTTAVMTHRRIQVEIDLDPIAIIWVTRRTFWGHVQSMVPTLLARFPEADAVRISGRAMLTDIRGNQRKDVAIWLEFSRADAAMINWQNVLRENLPKVATAEWSIQSFRD